MAIGPRGWVEARLGLGCSKNICDKCKHWLLPGRAGVCPAERGGRCHRVLRVAEELGGGGRKRFLPLGWFWFWFKAVI